MDIGFLTFWNNYKDKLNDTEFFKQEHALNMLAEPCGFDTLFCVEHHFNSYSMSPDNFQYLSYVAGQTQKIRLATMGAILPWNDPLRVVEKTLLLDHMSDGRAVLGMARGLAKREYLGFRQDLEESRERFDEAAFMVSKAVETGVIEGKGKYYPQPKTTLRPGPRSSFKNRIYMVAMSSDTVPVCAQIGAAQGIFAYKPWEDVLPDIEEYRRLYRLNHKAPPPPIATVDLTFCSDDEERAADLVRKYFGSFVEHYEIFGEHLASSKSYSSYSGLKDARDAVGYDAMADAFVNSNVCGSPTAILEKYEERRRIIGDFQPILIFSHSDASFAEIEGSIKRFASDVMPELRSWKMDGSEAA